MSNFADNNNMGLTAEEFNGIFKQYYSDLFYYAYGFIDNQETCRDLVSDVFGNAWETRHKLKIDTIKNYLYTSVRNGCIRYLRHEQAAQNYIEHIIIAAQADDGIQPEEYEARITHMNSVIDELPEKTRFVLERCYYQNKKYTEVAEELEISTNGVKKHIMKGLSTLRLRLKEKFIPDSGTRNDSIAYKSI